MPNLTEINALELDLHFELAFPDTWTTYNGPVCMTFGDTVVRGESVNSCHVCKRLTKWWSMMSSVRVCSTACAETLRERRAIREATHSG